MTTCLHAVRRPEGKSWLNQEQDSEKLEEGSVHLETTAAETTWSEVVWPFLGMKWLNELPEGDKGQRSRSLCHPPTRGRQKPGGGAAGRALGGQPTDNDTHPSNTEGNNYSRAKSHPPVFRHSAGLPRPSSILNPRHVSAGLTAQWPPRALLLTQHWPSGYPPPGPGAEGRGRRQPPPFLLCPGICQPRPSGLRGSASPA